MKVAFIGYGNMGGAMVRGLLSSGALAPRDIIVSNRTMERMGPLEKDHPEVERTADNSFAAGKSDLIFIGVRSDQAEDVLDEIAPSLSPSAHIVLINSGLSIHDAAGRFGLTMSMVIPTVTAEIERGVTLIHHSDDVSDRQKERLECMFSAVGEVVVADEERLEVGTALTSCGPAFAAAFIEELAEAAVRQGNYSREEALKMVTETVLATAELLSRTNISPAEVCRRVATPGGITERGLTILRQDLPGTLDEMMEAVVVRHHPHRKGREGKGKAKPPAFQAGADH